MKRLISFIVIHQIYINQFSLINLKHDVLKLCLCSTSYQPPSTVNSTFMHFSDVPFPPFHSNVTPLPTKQSTLQWTTYWLCLLSGPSNILTHPLPKYSPFWRQSVLKMQILFYHIIAILLQYTERQKYAYIGKFYRCTFPLSEKKMTRWIFTQFSKEERNLMLSIEK